MFLKHLIKLIKQKSYERTVFALRRHPIVFFVQLVFYVFLGLVGIGLYEFFNYIFPELFLGPVAYPLTVLGGSVYFLSLWLFIFTAFLDYFLDIWIFTNDRFINIEQSGLFARTISELDLYKIQDVTSEVKGIFPTFLNYGELYVQTAGEKQRFALKQIPNPHAVRQKILDLVEEDRKYHKNAEATRGF